MDPCFAVGLSNMPLQLSIPPKRHRVESRRCLGGGLAADGAEAAPPLNGKAFDGRSFCRCPILAVKIFPVRNRMAKRQDRRPMNPLLARICASLIACSAFTVVGLGCGFRTALDPGRIPQRHRTSHAECSMVRASGPFSCRCPSDTGKACTCAGDECGSDADCRAKRSGRCLAIDPYVPTVATCSYDECQKDTDCPDEVPCDCRESTDSYLPNRCLAGSDCQVDSDCGIHGFCSPSRFGQWCGQTYNCHSMADTCIDDSDCGNSGCNFDPGIGHWRCGGDCGPQP
jgi:hypothetical protein